jgi:glycosyltransferase involved in cell wall biosynthesis
MEPSRTVLGLVSAAAHVKPELAHTLLVIPALNEEEGLPGVLQEAKALGVATLVLDGGSTDGTCQVAHRLGVPVLHMPRGKGRAWAAFVDAFDFTAWKWVAMVGGDGTYDLAALPRLIKPGTDMVIGLRVPIAGETPKIRAFGARTLSGLAAWITGAPCPDLLSGLRVFRPDRLKEVRTTFPGFELETELTIKYIRRGLRVEWVPVTYRRRKGASKLSPVKDALRILWTMLQVRLERL